ncbi:peptidase inhibitor family I36 protein [Streptomyces sp. NPDC053427]|uniref:peptidase inhibitor family I36 protein n=1 Tax=Streptomyces sp. NPDC053427 TaxID=3365701 RepID=UPI0037D14C04
MRIRQITAAGAAATALVLGAALPASADGSPSAGASHAPAAHHVTADLGALKAKPKKKVLVFEDAKYQGKRTHFTKNVPNLKAYGWNDTISSAKNQGKRTVTFYATKNYHGAKFALASGQREAHFGDRGMADTTTSIRFN